MVFSVPYLKNNKRVILNILFWLVFQLSGSTGKSAIPRNNQNSGGKTYIVYGKAKTMKN